MYFKSPYIKKTHPRSDAYRVGAWEGDGSVTQITRQLIRKARRKKNKENK